MIVSCPSCKTKFSLDDGLIRSPFQKMRCSRCHNVFVYQVEPGMLEEAMGENAPARPKKRGLTVFLFVLLLLVAAAAGGYFYWVNYLGANNGRLKIQKSEGQEIIIKDGRIFLITGFVWNGSTKARKFFLLRAKIFDGDDRPIAEKHSLAGLVLPKEELPGMQKQEALKRVNEFKMAPIETFQADRNKDLPFAILFVDGDFSKVKTFSVEVIDSPLL